MKRKNYSKEFKWQVVSLILTDGHPVRFVSKQLDVHENTLYRWVSEYEKYGERAFPGHGSREFISQQEVKRLTKENEQLREELELLKSSKSFSRKTRNYRLLRDLL